MSMKDTVENALHATKNAVADVRDRADETIHRSAADAEKTRREVAGENMTPSEKLVSGATEVQHRTQAELDRAKRALR